MKILRIIARLNVGGPARHVVWLSSGLQDAEFQSSLIAGSVPQGEEDMSYFAVENGVEPLFIEEMSRELTVKDVVSLYKVYRKIKQERPDVIHTHTAKAGTIGRAAAFFYKWLTWRSLIGRPRNVKVVHTFHGHVFHSYYGRLKTKLFIIIEKCLARFATDKIVVISPQQLADINDRFGIGRASQFAVVPLGIDLERLREKKPDRDAFRTEISAEKDELVVGFVGRLTEIKNISLLLRVAAQCKSHTGAPKLKFVIVGDGHLRQPLEAQAKELRISDFVQFLGNRRDIAAVYAGLDIVALTSMNEGTPLSLVEAMAAGCAVISTGVGGVLDLLGAVGEEHEGFKVCERGIRIDSMDVGGYFAGLIYLAGNEKLRTRLIANGKEFVEAQYGKNRLIRDIKELYRELVAA